MLLAPTFFLAKPFLIILGATLSAAVANFAVQFVLARALGPNQFGAFLSAFAIVTLLSPLAAFGLSSWWLRVFGEEGYAAQRWVKPSLQFSALSSFAVIALLIAWASLGPHENQTAALIATLTGVVLAQVIIDLVSAKFQLEAKHIELAAWQFISHPLRLAGLLLLVFCVPLLTAFHVASLYLAISVLIFAIGIFYLADFYNGKLRLAGHEASAHGLKTKGNLEGRSLKEVLARAFPFGLESFLFLVYYQTDLILLRYLANEEAVGFYGASVIFMAAAYLLPSVLYQKFLLPKIHRWAYEESSLFKAFIKKGGVLLFAAGLLVMFIIWYLGEYLISTVLGENYYPSVSLLMLMSLAIPFRYVSIHLGSVLCTRDLIWANLKVAGFTALLNVLLNLVLIPPFGGLGAAVATVLSYIALAFLCMAAVHKKFWRN
jgi:O-antigen/teichoic acid export membrane protein